MAREISRAEAFERAHEIFTQVNFNSFDFNTIKESLLDYTKLYFPEDFNDYIESSEFIAILELFAYIGELLAYRLDINAHENFITTAERKESILRLAKMVSYKASRNIPARGLVKLTSIQTTETVIDSLGRNIAGRRVAWNDSNNPDWKEQFVLIMNRVLEQEFGTVAPSERVQVDDVLFELYTLNNNPLTGDGQVKFSFGATVSGTSVPMELVPIKLIRSGPEERRPELNTKFSLLFANDGLGDGSDTTGFLMFAKQGTLQFRVQTFDGVTPNQTFDILVDNINETDVFVNNVDPNTRQILTDDPFAKVLPHLVSEDLRFGEWIEVDLANAQNIIFNTNRNRHKYEIETLDNDRVRLVFGDGEFSDIPSGTFHIWFRTSVNTELAVPKNVVSDNVASFTYNDLLGNVQTITFSYSLVSSLLNSSPSETIDHVRRTAPAVYYTQDRMVNARDYNVFMLQDPTIVKLRAINRTFAGDSKYIAWHDPRENYEDVKLFGDDLALYWVERLPDKGGLTVVNTALSANELLTNFIEPLLSITDFFAILGPRLQAMNINPGEIRRLFSNEPLTFNLGITETDAILEGLNNATSAVPIVDLFYSIIYDEWTVGQHGCQLESSLPPHMPPVIPGCTRGPADSIWMIRIEARFSGSILSGWDVRWRTRRLLAHSEHTRFWNTNTTTKVINFDTLNTVNDRIFVLAANKDANGTQLLSDNKTFKVLSQELVEQNLPNSGLPDIHRLSVLPEDVNGDNISDDLLQDDLFDGQVEQLYSLYEISTDPLDTPQQDHVLLFPNGRTILRSADLDDEIEIFINGTKLSYPETFDVAPSSGDDTILDRIKIDPVDFPTLPLPGPAPTVIKIVFKDYVYFRRESATDPYVPQFPSDEIKLLFALDDAVIEDDRRFKRHEGRFPLNFAWFHFTIRLHLVDPTATNIIDMFIITKGYNLALRRFIENKTDIRPAEPTPLELRTAYARLLDNKMISDTVILHTGKFKLLFGSRSIPELRAILKVIRPTISNLTDNQVKVKVVETIRGFFNIDSWEFGETFFFSELTGSIHSALGPEIDSIVLVPLFAQNQFGDLYQIQAREDELFLPDINTVDIEIVRSYTPENLRQSE